MKLNKSPFSIALITILLILVISMLFLGFWKGPEKEEDLPEIPPNYYKCGANLVPFRANITDCESFLVTPANSALNGVVLNPFVQSVFILVDPKGSNTLGMSAYDVYKTLNSLLVPSGVVYTEQVENQSGIPVMSVENSTPEFPIIWLRDGQDKNLIEVSGSTVTVYAQTPYDLDAAACKIAILAINDKFDCSVKE